MNLPPTFSVMKKKGEIDRFVLRRAEKVSLQGQGETNQDEGLFISLSENEQRTYFAVSTCPFTCLSLSSSRCVRLRTLCAPPPALPPAAPLLLSVQRFSKIAATLLGNPSGLCGGDEIKTEVWCTSIELDHSDLRHFPLAHTAAEARTILAWGKHTFT